MRVARITEDYFGTTQNRSDIPRNLAVTEFGSGLASPDIEVIELSIPAAVHHRHIVRQQGNAFTRRLARIRSTFSSLRREAVIVKTLLQTRAIADVVLVNQGVGLRAGLLRSLRISLPKIAALCYDPFPAISTMETRHHKRGASTRIRSHLFDQLQLIVVVSKTQAKFVDAFLRRAKVCAIPMSIDSEVFVPHKVQRDKFIFMVDGILRDYKLLADALCRVEDAPGRLVVAHRLDLSPSTLEELNRIRESGWEVDTVHKATSQQLARYYSTCQLVVVPVAESSQPAGLTALLESLSMGCSVVCTSASWLSDYAKDEQDILIADNSSSTEFATQVSRLRNDAKLAGKLRQDALELSRKWSFNLSQHAMQDALRTLNYKGRNH